MADWTSLPPELVRRIAECLLDTNDLDCYVDFRAVCSNWRSATDDPKNSSELRFRPRRWIIIDEIFQSDSRLLVNTASGRVVRKDLPVLRNYYLVATTHGGFFVLADQEPPHVAVVLNPFTGHMIRFKAPVPSDVDISAALLTCPSTGKLPMTSVVSDIHSSPTLVLVYDTCQKYMATPDSDRFTPDFDEDEEDLVLTRLAVAGGIGATDGWQTTEPPLPITLANKIFRVMKLFAIDTYDMFCVDHSIGFVSLPGPEKANHFFLVESAGELLVIIKLQKHLKIFRLDNLTDCDVLEPVKSIGDRAIFVGHYMCVSVIASKFPSIKANCVYYVKSCPLHISKYDLETEKEEMVSEAIYFLKCIKVSNSPFTIVQLFCSYTINVRKSQLGIGRLTTAGSSSYLDYPDICSDYDLDDDEFCE